MINPNMPSSSSSSSAKRARPTSTTFTTTTTVLALLLALLLSPSLPTTHADDTSSSTTRLGRRALQSSFQASHSSSSSPSISYPYPSSPFFPSRINPNPGTDRCTTMIVGPGGSADGSTMTTHTADCAECDFRLAKVPARDWPAGSQRPIYLFASAYPRRVQEGRSATWEPANLDESLPQAPAWKKEGYSKIIGYIPQVNHTYALIEGLYAIENEHQVAIGESTCSGRFWTKPRGVEGGGEALLEIGELSAIALERCKTARCAIETMGGLAEEYGYYGAEWEGQMDDVIAEAGEALVVGDPKEAWVFHILPDDTGKSAVWAAQRVPDGHISLVANQFVVRGVKKGRKEEFLYSSNVWEVAERNKLWKEEDGDLDFLKVYGYMRVHAAYATRRVWRVFTLAAPSLLPSLPSSVDDFGDGYPFSVKPDQKLTPADMMRFQRDHYEGTEFDLTQGVAAGPYGDPNRYDPSANKGENVTLLQAQGGFYERSISLFRTSYSTVTQSRGDLPNLVGGRVWLCQYMPAMSTYTPLYVGAPSLPPSYTRGSLFKYEKGSNYWSAASVGNWATRFYRFIRQDVEESQRKVEGPLMLQADMTDRTAMEKLATGDMKGAEAVLSGQADLAAKAALDTWNGLFEFLIARYRDGYKVKDMLCPTFEQESLFYPYWWLQLSGFFEHSLKMVNPEPLPALKMKEGGKEGGRKGEMLVTVTGSVEPDGGRWWWQEGREGWYRMSEVLVLVLVAVAFGFWWGRNYAGRSSYTTLGI